ncbi:hypothetical protein J0H58_37820 [bacterium]|nr:hypothetical protein [bacterium]
MNKELRKSEAIRAMLEQGEREKFIPVVRLKLWARPMTLPDTAYETLGRKFPTAATWEKTKPAHVYEVLEEFGLDADDAEALLKKVRKGLATFA